MKHCPNASCAFRRKHGRAAEYRDDIERCDCGAVLTAGSEPAPPPRPVVSLLSERADVPVELGPVRREVPLRDLPAGWLGPVVLGGSGVALMVFGAQQVGRAMDEALLPLLGGAGLVVVAAVTWVRRPAAVQRSLVEREHGLVYRAGDRTWHVPYAQLKAAALEQEHIIVRGVPAATRYQLVFQLGDEHRAIVSIGPGPLSMKSDPFVDWARAFVTSWRRSPR